MKSDEWRTGILVCGDSTRLPTPIRKPARASLPLLSILHSSFITLH